MISRYKSEQISKICPLTKSELRLMNEIEIENFNSKLKEDNIIYLNGDSFNGKLKEGFISTTIGLIYPKSDDANMILPKNALVAKTELMTLWRFLFQRFC